MRSVDEIDCLSAALGNKNGLGLVILAFSTDWEEGGGGCTPDLQPVSFRMHFAVGLLTRNTTSPFIEI
jgi:hypothetical protein